MKNLLLIAVLLFTVGCGNHSLEYKGKVYDCYGLFDRKEIKKDNVVYEISAGNMLGNLILFETVLVPIWNLGWNTYCPTKVLDNPEKE